MYEYVKYMPDHARYRGDHDDQKKTQFPLSKGL